MTSSGVGCEDVVIGCDDDDDVVDGGFVEVLEVDGGIVMVLERGL
jgi:hypothetical protein